MSTTRRCSDWSSVPEPGAQWVADSAGVCFSARLTEAPHLVEGWGAFDSPVVLGPRSFVDSFLLRSGKEECRIGSPWTHYGACAIMRTSHSTRAHIKR